MSRTVSDRPITNPLGERTTIFHLIFEVLKEKERNNVP